MRLLLGLAALAGTAIMTVKAMQARKRNDETGEVPNDVGPKQVNWNGCTFFFVKVVLGVQIGTGGTQSPLKIF